MSGKAQMRVMVRCDAGMQLGSGHVMRCLTLADAMAERGAEITFACSGESFDIVKPLASSGHRKIRLVDPLDPAELLGADHRWDAAVVDHYALDAGYEAALRRASRVILVIDDLADRPHDCDILLDQTLGREAADYASLVGPAAELLLGPQFALLRPEFARARPAALAARARGGPVRRILVSLGMTDLGGITARAVKAALAAGLDAEVAVAVGSRAESLPELRKLAATDRRVSLKLDCQDICSLMAASDIAIGAGGTTSWERCCLGLPTVMLVLTGNQVMIAQELAKIGAAIVQRNHDPDSLATALGNLSNDDSARFAMSRAAASITDGNGASRIVVPFSVAVTKARERLQ